MESWTLIKLNDFCKDEDRVLKFLMERNLVKNEMVCPNCGWTMKIAGKNWICYKQIKTKQGRKKCLKKISIKKGTCFDKTRLGFGEVLKLIYLLIHNLEQQFISKELGISKNTVSQWNAFVKEVLIEWMGSVSEVLGGPGKIVEIDEFKFIKRKYNKEHAVEEQWIFGGIQRESHKILIIPIENRNSEALMKFIKKWILPGTTIISDCQRGYKNLNEEGYNHLTVGHPIGFKNEETGAHINTIKSLWRHIKEFLPSYSRKKDNFIGYLAHYAFIKNSKMQKINIFDLFLKQISQFSFNEFIESDSSESETESDNVYGCANEKKD